MLDKGIEILWNIFVVQIGIIAVILSTMGLYGLLQVILNYIK